MEEKYHKTFKQVAEEWLDSIRGKVASTTYDRYSDALERDIYPEYADKPMRDVTFSEMNRFLKQAPELAKNKGRTAHKSTIQVLRAVFSNIIQYADGTLSDGLSDDLQGIRSYEELSVSELESLVLRAKFNRCPEMLAALLSIYCGMRVGELSALSSDDVDMDRMEIYIHRTAHRVKNPDKDAQKKTVIVVEEIPRKKQIRTVVFPDVLKDYIEDFRISGRYLIRSRDDGFMDMRTLENRLSRIMATFHLEGINFERLRKTYINNKADTDVLDNIFLGNSPDRPYEGSVDRVWLTDEMKRDLIPLRTLIGLSEREMGNILGVSEDVYRAMETGDIDIRWDQYMTMLFVFHYNGRTVDVVDGLGLYPDSLKNRLDI